MWSIFAGLGSKGQELMTNTFFGKSFPLVGWVRMTSDRYSVEHRDISPAFDSFMDIIAWLKEFSVTSYDRTSYSRSSVWSCEPTLSKPTMNRSHCRLGKCSLTYFLAYSLSCRTRPWPRSSASIRSARRINVRPSSTTKHASKPTSLSPE